MLCDNASEELVSDDGSDYIQPSKITFKKNITSNYTVYILFFCDYLEDDFMDNTEVNAGYMDIWEGFECLYGFAHRHCIHILHV